MAHSNNTYNTFDNILIPAILFSIGLHLVAAIFVHPFQFDAERVLPTLEVELQQPKPEPPPPPPPEPPQPEPPKPTPRKMLPPPVRMLQSPQPEERAILQPPAVTPPPQIIAATPAKDVEPAFVAPTPPPEVKRSVEPVAVDVDADLGQYGSLLAREFAKHKQYPRIAQMRGWQGTVRVKLEVDANGTVTSSTISESSSFEALDKQALEMVKKASPLPLPPETLRHRPFTITIPVVFRLE